MRNFLIGIGGFIIGFSLASLVLAALSNQFRDLWHPVLWIFWFLLAPICLPSLQSIVRRVFLAGFIGAGAVSIWFISVPTPPHVSYPKYEFLIPFIGIVGPIFVGILWISWQDSHRGDLSQSWGWSLIAALFLWTDTYLCGPNGAGSWLVNKMDTSLHLSPVNVILISKLLPIWGRPLYFFLFAGIVWSIANRAKGGRASRVFFAFGSCALLAWYEHLRPHEFHWTPASITTYEVPLVAAASCIALFEFTLSPR